MNSARGFYKFLIFIASIFTFLVFLPQRQFVLAGCTLVWKDCNKPYEWDCGDSKEDECPWSGSFDCINREGYCWTRYTCDCGGPSCCGGCFVEGTEIDIEQESKRAGEQEGTEKIENLEVGDIVSSFNPETGEISESQVAEVHKITREGYYELETESGKKVKVTAEHPFLAIKSEENLISKLKNALSNTLTFRLITGLRTKLIEVLE